MPKVPNRRHVHHLNPEDQRTAFIQAVTNVGQEILINTKMSDFRTFSPSAFFLHSYIVMQVTITTQYYGMQ
jgi:hypothetical protein